MSAQSAPVETLTPLWHLPRIRRSQRFWSFVPSTTLGRQPAVVHKASRHFGNRAFSFGHLTFKQFSCLRGGTGSIRFAEVYQYFRCSYPGGGGSLRRDHVVGGFTAGLYGAPARDFSGYRGAKLCVGALSFLLPIAAPVPNHRPGQNVFVMFGRLAAKRDSFERQARAWRVRHRDRPSVGHCAQTRRCLAARSGKRAG
jgi:hypothetical protein